VPRGSSLLSRVYSSQFTVQQCSYIFLWAVRYGIQNVKRFLSPTMFWDMSGASTWLLTYEHGTVLRDNWPFFFQEIYLWESLQRLISWLAQFWFRTLTCDQSSLRWQYRSDDVASEFINILWWPFLFRFLWQVYDLPSSLTNFFDKENILISIPITPSLCNNTVP
jgi:hypothetical protein